MLHHIGSRSLKLPLISHPIWQSHGFYQWNKWTVGFFSYFQTQLCALHCTWKVREALNPRSLIMYYNMHHTSRVQTEMLCSVRSDLWHVWGFCYKTIQFQTGAEGRLPTLKEVFPVNRQTLSIPRLQQSKYYKQQPVKNYLNCSKEPLDSFLAFGLLK